MDRWTLQEAQAYLPRLRRLLEVIGAAAHFESRISTNGHRSMGLGRADGSPQGAGSGTPPGSASGSGVDDPDVDPSGALAEIEERGIILRDVGRGLVDFPSRHPDGTEVLLCWQLGEPDIAWWHLPDDGIAGRRPLPLPPSL